MATQADQQDAFRRSYQQQCDYPQNIVHKGTYSVSLKQSSQRLISSEERLFTTLESEVNLPFRDFESDGTVVKHKVWSDETLKTHLGDASTPDPLDPARLVGDIVTKADPQCRFVFCSGGHSRRSLLLTAEMFKRLMTFHQVMPAYVDLVTMFGNHEKARDLRFGRFSEQTLIAASSQGPALNVAGRSGRFYQMCFNLKTPSQSEATAGTSQWYIRQAAIYHYFDVTNGRTCWIMTKGDWLLKNRVQELTTPRAIREGRSFTSPAACFRSSLDVHLMLCHWSTEGWRDYLERFEHIVDSETDMAVKGLIGTKSAHMYDLEEVQAAQGYQDKMNEAIMVMKLNIRIIESIRKYYDKLVTNQHFTLKLECEHDVVPFAAQLDDMKHDMESHISRAELLVQIVADRKAMIVQHLQAQTTSTMEDLTKSMHQIGIQSQTEAIAMRIITVVTLLYLPATFVSTFFSTDVVKYQNDNGDSSTGTTSGDDTSFSRIALERWLEVTLPLTLITLLAAFYFFRRSMKSRLRALGLSDMVALTTYYVPEKTRK